MQTFNFFTNQMKNVTRAVLALSMAGVLLISSITPAFAGTDLTATCPAIGVCTISPSGTPLLDEAGWVPGSAITQRFSVADTSSQNGFVAVEVTNYQEIKNLGEVINIEIREGSAVGPLVYNGVSLHEFRDDGYFTIDGISAGQTINYYLTATMETSAGNQYQAADVEFDLRLGLEIAAIPPTSGGGDGGGNPGGGGSGGTSPANPPVCSDQTPSAGPSLTITNVGTNTVSLSWSAVSPVTHYALVFTRTSDGAQYGSANIGNVTSFTVDNLSGGANYSFEVFGVNGCAPGPRSTIASSGNVPGPFIGGRPTGGGQVLGDTDPDATPSPTPSVTNTGTTGEVAGATDDTCEPWRMYVPWILLVAQLVFVLANEYYFRKDQGMTKHFLTVGITLVSIFLFYLLRSCPCYSSGNLWILVWLCTWYWVVSLLLSALVRAVSYAFIEEVEDKPTATKVTSGDSLTGLPTRDASDVDSSGSSRSSAKKTDDTDATDDTTL